MTKSNITISEYLILRLSQMGVKHVFGVPGDYNLPFLDYVEDSLLVNWIGNCNELNAAYATDGYARSIGVGALVTTGGVGELSAINGLAGSYAENVPLIHIVGMPSTVVQEQKLPNHHTFADGDYNKFIHMQEAVTSKATILSKDNADNAIDETLLSCWENQKPVVIGVAVDLFEHLVPFPATKLDFSLDYVDIEQIESQASSIYKRLIKAQKPLIIIDGKCRNHGMITILKELIHTTMLPVATTFMAKGMIDEDLPNFIGNYFGEFSNSALINYVKDADLILWCGQFITDVNSGRFTMHHEDNSVIKLNLDTLVIENEVYKTNGLQLCKSLEKHLADYSHKAYKLVAKEENKSPQLSKNTLRHANFWSWAQAIVKPDSTIIADAGTSIFGVLEMKLAKKVQVITQLLWGSIGYSLGATVGVLASSVSKNVYLFIGDGSFQLTAQEVSTMLRNGFTPIIFLINNDGYTIERYIHGENRHYNDIADWDYSKLVESFAGKVKTWKIRDFKQLELLGKELEEYQGYLRFVEVYLAKNDAPLAMHKFFGKE